MDIKAQYLQAMDIQAWQLKTPAAAKTSCAVTLLPEWDLLRRAVASCTACGLENPHANGFRRRRCQSAIDGDW